MVSEANRLEDQLRRAFEGEAWHGPSVLEALAGVSPGQACAHPVSGAHGIWELVLHLGSAYRLVLRRLRGDGTPLTPAEDWPPVPPPTADGWREAVRVLRELNEELRRAVRAFPAERLDEPLVAESPSAAYVQLIGITQHDLYHAGQISLLKKTLATAGLEHRMRLALVEGELGVARLAADDPAPDWAAQGSIFSLTRTADELSVVCAAQAIPVGVRAERGWRCLRVVGPLDFSLTGILASILDPLAAAKVSVFTISTYDTDYVLVRSRSLGTAIECLAAAGHEVLG